MKIETITMRVSENQIIIDGEPDVIKKVKKTLRENLYFTEINEIAESDVKPLSNQCSGCEFDFNDCKKEGRFKEDYSCRKPMGESL